MNKDRLKITLDDTKPKGLHKVKIKIKKYIDEKVESYERATSQQVGKLTTEQKLGKFFRTLKNWGLEMAEAAPEFPAAAKNLKWAAIIFFGAMLLLVLLKFFS